MIRTSVRRQVSILVGMALIVLSLGTFSSTRAQITTIRPSTPEQSADEYAAAGRYSEALLQYKTAWLGWKIGRSETDAELRTARERLAGKMGAILAKMSPAPPVPDDADFHAQKGAAFVKLAKTPLDFLKAASQFQDAINDAPWVFDYHFNLAIAFKSAGQFGDALNALKIAKLLAANEKDRRDANALRAEIEAGQELAVSAKAESEEQTTIPSEVKRLEGDWYQDVSSHDMSRSGVRYLETLSIKRNASGVWEVQFLFTGNGVVQADYHPYEVRFVGTELQFKMDQTFDGAVVVTYAITPTVSADGNTLKLAYRPMPFTAAQEAHWAKWRNYVPKPHVDEFRRK